MEHTHWGSVSSCASDVGFLNSGQGKVQLPLDGHELASGSFHRLPKDFRMRFARGVMPATEAESDGNAYGQQTAMLSKHHIVTAEYN